MRKRHQFTPPVVEPEVSVSREVTIEIQTTMAEPQDRMLRYRKPPCPECGMSPVVTVQKRGPYASYRCRECGFRFEEVR